MQSGICGDPRFSLERVGNYRKKLIMEAIFGEWRCNCECIDQNDLSVDAAANDDEDVLL